MRRYSQEAAKGIVGIPFTIPNVTANKTFRLMKLPYDVDLEGVDIRYETTNDADNVGTFALKVGATPHASHSMTDGGKATWNESALQSPVNDVVQLSAGDEVDLDFSAVAGTGVDFGDVQCMVWVRIKG